MMNEEEYTKKYNITEDFANKTSDKFRAKQLSYDETINLI